MPTVLERMCRDSFLTEAKEPNLRSAARNARQAKIINPAKTARSETYLMTYFMQQQHNSRQVACVVDDAHDLQHM